MKLASRISSIRRIAWKQCRSCSADSLSMWPDSFARCALAGWMRSPRASSTLRDRVLGEPVDLEVRVQLAQLVRDRGVALRVPEADRRGDVERPLAARLAAHPARRRTRGGEELAQQQVDLDRIAHVRAVARALEHRRGRRRWPPRARSRGSGPVIASSEPWITSTGQRRRPASSRVVSASRSLPADSVATSVSALVSRPQPTQSSIGFVECGSVNICEKKNSRKPL